MAKEGEDFEGLAELATLAVVPQRLDVYTLNKATDEKIWRTIRVAPMSFDMCSEFFVLVRPIMKTLPKEVRLDELHEFVANFVADHAKEARGMVAVATEEDPKYIGSLPADQFLSLIIVVFEVNRDFFVRHVGPTFQLMAEKMFGGIGPTLSTVSQNTGT